MSYDEDHIAMAAEYVLGTLSGDERSQVETMMSVDPEFKVLVAEWERRLGELHAMVGSVEPSDEVWAKIRTAVTAIAPEAAMRLPEVTVPAAVIPAPTVTEIVPDHVAAAAGGSRGWRSLALLASALALLLAAFVAVQALRPDLLPARLRPQPKIEYVQLQPPPPPAQHVAVLQRDGGAPAFIMTIDPEAKEFTVRKTGADAPAGRSYELWMVSDRFTQPRSLGVIGPTDFTTKPVSTFDKETVRSAIYAVTLEVAGGSPSGAPTVAPLYAGKLIETVPAASTPRPAADPAKK
jgi:anti-sigma-K factor RskA